MIERMQAHFGTLLAGALAAPRQRISALPLLTDDERETILTKWNATDRELAADAHIVPLFEKQVERTPDSVAAVFGAQRVSYQDLNRRANQIARLLTREGVGPDSVVGLLAERGIDPLVAILGVFKVGGAYLPLDPAHPVARTREIIERSGVLIALASPALTPHLAEAGEGSQLRVIPLDSSTAAEEDGENVPRTGSPGDLAYIIFTSGSTGSPKGAMIEHRGMLNHLIAKIEDLEITGTDRIAQTASQCFDISVWQLLAGLLVGARIVIFEDEIAHDPMRLLDGLQKDEISIVEVVPSMLRAMLETVANSSPLSLPALRWMIATGEALPPSLAREWYQRYPTVPMLNAYGPTECSDDVTHFVIRIPPSDGETQIPIGRPIANTRLYIVDPAGSPVPVGIAGELQVGGEGVGRGYLNDPVRTAQAFVPDPFRPGRGARLYKTGDLARYRPDGNIEFLGRIDHQVKIRGFRIELGELETVLARHPAVKACVVVALPAASGEKRLVAYFVARDRTATQAALRQFLKGSLPDYMLPSAFVELDALPLTPNGKVDRKALPSPGTDRPELDKPFVAPRDSLELELATIWERVFPLDSVGVQDDFFELGGHSLIAGRMFAEIEKSCGRSVPPTTLLQAPTIEKLALLLRGEREASRWSSLVPIQTGGGRPPLFCMHAGAGTILFYQDLAHALGSDQPVFGLQARGLYGGQPPHADIEEMADHYVSEIRTVQPTGPYFLTGFCFGGLMAFAVASRLRRDGGEVALLSSFEGGSPRFDYAYEDEPERSTGEWLTHHGSALRELGARERLFYLVRKGRGRLHLWTRLLRRRLYAPLSHLLRRMGRPLPEFLRQTYFRLMTDRAAKRYSPGPYPGRMVLFQTEGFFQDKHLGWDGYLEDGIEVHEIPVSNTGRYHADFIRAVAEPFRRVLDDASETFVSSRPPGAAGNSLREAR